MSFSLLLHKFIFKKKLISFVQTSDGTFDRTCLTWGDLLDQDGCLGGHSEAVRVEAWVLLNLNIEAKGVIPLIGASLPLHRISVSGGD